jgi:hypothetical protein
MPEVDMLLDGSITEDEIKRAINNLKKMVRLVGMMVS